MVLILTLVFNGSQNVWQSCNSPCLLMTTPIFCGVDSYFVVCLCRLIKIAAALLCSAFPSHTDTTQGNCFQHTWNGLCSVWGHLWRKERLWTPLGLQRLQPLPGSAVLSAAQGTEHANIEMCQLHTHKGHVQTHEWTNAQLHRHTETHVCIEQVHVYEEVNLERNHSWNSNSRDFN